ncbi:MAG: UDP-N-acetylmuramate--L-alanine ligase, partial [Immundisolibacteraceae bacterium]|nr:UDP-N-acetylmuramate--L-alanine ligase [Immundisolibacteraceae bacterium]
SRTRDLFDEFCKELAEADLLVLLDVYPAGESPISGADGPSLAKAIRQRGKLDPVFLGGQINLFDGLEPLVKTGDLVLALGAGSIGAMVNELVDESLRKAGSRS